MSLIGTTEVKKRLIGKIHLLREIPGFSAYELAVKHGYKGTEEEWLEYIKGPKGEPGTLQSHTEVDALGHRVINVAEPEAETDGATKKYVDDTFGKVEDITDKFYVDGNEFLTWQGKVYKCGKLIFGNMFSCATYPQPHHEILQINQEYRPVTGCIFNAHLENDKGNPPKTICVQYRSDDGKVYIEEAYNEQIYGFIYMSFTYICE